MTPGPFGLGQGEEAGMVKIGGDDDSLLASRALQDGRVCSPG
jgi:hypothetical protein